MIPLTGWRHIGNSTPLHLGRVKSGSYKPQKPFSIKVLARTHRAHSLRAHMRISGWQVGSDPEIQVATVVSNHLVAGLMKYFGDSGRFQQVANLFEKLLTREPEVASLLARSYIGMSMSQLDLWKSISIAHKVPVYPF
jgi:hypothetical protein